MKPDIRQDADRQMIRAEAAAVVRHARLPSGVVSIQYGKPAPAAGFVQGALAAPDNEVIEWTGIKDGTPTATTKTIKCHWSTGTFAQAEAVVVTTMADGSKVVSCFPGGLS